MIILQKGNILDAKESIVHQVNCQNVMGSGVAKAIYTKWPIVKEQYHEFCSEAGSPYNLIGRVQMVPLNKEFQFVFNVFGQLNYGRDKNLRYTDYIAVESALRWIRQNFKGAIAFPFGFGCGLANGDWQIVEGMICDIFDDREVKIYKL